MWNQTLWTEIITNEKECSAIKAAYAKYAEINGISYANVAELVEKLPKENVFMALPADVVYEVVGSVVSWKKATKNVLRSITGEEIRAFSRGGEESSRNIRKLWYKIKSLLQTLYRRAFTEGNYKSNLDTEADFYEEMPKKLSEAIQYWTTEQIEKETDWVGQMSTSVRAAVCSYSDMGIADISRMRAHQKRVMNYERLLGFFQQFKTSEDFKGYSESKYKVMVNSYVETDEIVRAIQTGIDEDRDTVYFVAMVEKDTEFELLKAMGEYIGISVISGHGQNSVASLEQLKGDLGMEEGAQVIFLSITDTDPSGLKIARAPAEQQFTKMGVKTLAWVHSLWHLKLDKATRQAQCYIPKFAGTVNGSDEELKGFNENWVKTFGYKKDTDVFGGGKFGFEIEVMNDTQIRECFAELCFAIGFTPENILESYKIENREDADSCADTAGDHYANTSEAAKVLRQLESLKNKALKPLDDLIYKARNAKSEIADRAEKEYLPLAEEKSEESNFDDRDVTKYVDSFKRDFLNGRNSWSNRYGSEVTNNRSLTDKLVKYLDDQEIEVDTSDIEIPEVDEEAIIKSIQEQFEDSDDDSEEEE
jgi:hypothetical protein